MWGFRYLTSWTGLLRVHTFAPFASHLLEVWLIELQMRAPRCLRLSLQKSQADRHGMEASITDNTWQKSEYCTNHAAPYRTTINAQQIITIEDPLFICAKTKQKILVAKYLFVLHICSWHLFTYVNAVMKNKATKKNTCTVCFTVKTNTVGYDYVT